LNANSSSTGFSGPASGAIVPPAGKGLEGDLMTDASVATGREFRIGPVFSRAWSVYIANFLMFTLVALVISLPNLLSGEGQTPSGIFWNFAVFIFWMIANTVGLAVILYGAFQAMRGRAVVIGEAIRRGLSRFWPIVGLAILQWLGIAVGFLLFIVPGIMLAVRWSVALPACVVEGLGPTASMGRSAELTKGHRWKIFGVYLLIMIIALIFIGIIGALVAGLFGSPFSAAALERGIGIGTLLWLIVTAIYTAYFNIFVVMMYNDLRAAKEGIDTDQIAAVFD
jgi:Membrane domain of glycerophosphoryl diester phosphodiesterase